MSHNSRLWPAVALLTWSLQAGAVIGATKDLPDNLHKAFPEIVRLQSEREVCTGTIIGPRVVLSAAHCADLKNSFFIYKGERYEVKFTSSRDYKNKEHDVAVALTTRDIKDAEFGVIGSGLRHGSRIFFAGFGCTHPGGQPGQLRMGLTQVIGMDEDHILSASKDGAILCQGDSGGPAFLRENGENVVVAVNSAGDIRNVNVNVRLDSQLSRGFLRRVADHFKVAICGVTAVCAKKGAVVAALAR
ncbi:MAG: S1 family peptidase [Bdellovibrionales bacterium]|nr:S1 family peptidase [Bdellovibrionales bacterium]